MKDPKKISSRNIEKLLGELMPPTYGCYGAEVVKLENEAEELEKKLLANAKLKSLHVKAKKLRDAIDAARETQRRKVRAVRKFYYTEGATPRVVAMLTGLVEASERP